jgi:hypothetical protein
MKSKNYTKYIAALAGNKGLNKIQSVYYRGKDPENPASNYYFRFTDEHGLKYKIFWNDGISEAWVNRWFTPNACNYCDDVFAELADVTFMDAWLPEYSKDSMGTNLVLVRSPLVKEVITEGAKHKEIKLSEISIKKVVQSQSGVIDLKRRQLPHLIYLAEKKGVFTPIKRFKVSKKIGVFEKIDIEIKGKMQKMSKNLFVENYNYYVLDNRKFKKGLNKELKKMYMFKIIHYVIFKKLIKEKGVEDTTV